MIKMKIAKEKLNSAKGFFLVELIVAVFVFTIVMTVSVGSLIVGIDANKKTQSLKSVLNNLDIALDTMTKTIAVGGNYSCGATGEIPPETSDCGVSGDTSFTFLLNEDLNGDGSMNDSITYSFETDDAGGYLSRTLHSDGGEPIRMTAPEVNITDMRFFVTGSQSSDIHQPRVRIVINGTSPAGPRSAPTEFMVQTVVSQRGPDF